jgi:hypothetical protein
MRPALLRDGNAMETNDDRIALGVLRFLGEMYDITGNFSRRLREEFGMDGKTRRAPTSSVECRSYRTGAVIHSWVEADVQGQDSLTWEMDIRKSNEGWLVDASVCRVVQGDGGTDTVLQLTDKVEPTFDVVERNAPIVLNNLYEAGLKILIEELQLG